MFVCKAPNGLAPLYLSEILALHEHNDAFAESPKIRVQELG